LLGLATQNEDDCAARAVCVRPSAIEVLRAATRIQHARLDERLDAVTQLCDPHRRLALCRRYAALHIPADAVFAAWLGDIPELDLGGRSRTPLLAKFAADGAFPAFPEPASQAEALGMLYVLEGSTLGGRFILRAIAARGIAESALSFLDPYGERTGAQWRSFLAVLAREIGDDELLVAAACRGAVRAFDHAERILCGDAP
jgi:heme oxygenase